ncbi:Ku protein [bacterium]|nr:Ku protein [bacterium]
MAFSYKAAISFGLVYIPVKLHAAVKSNEIGFNMLEKNTKSRIKYKKTCVDCDGREVKQEDIIKGYEYEDDKYVIFTEKDFEKVKSSKDKNITIERFVELGEIDPIYYDKAYYVEPTGGERAFSLLIKAMQEDGKAGIAKTVLGTKETLIVLRARDNRLIINTLFFYEEVQKPSFNIATSELNQQELTLAKTLIAGMSGNFEAADFKDEYSQKIKAAIEAKIAGKEIEVTAEKQPNSIANLMDALKESVKNIRKPENDKMPEQKKQTVKKKEKVNA